MNFTARTFDILQGDSTIEGNAFKIIFFFFFIVRPGYLNQGLSRSIFISDVLVTFIPFVSNVCLVLNSESSKYCSEKINGRRQVMQLRWKKYEMHLEEKSIELIMNRVESSYCMDS